jgi:diamine N-acetyltransferase
VTAGGAGDMDPFARVHIRFARQGDGAKVLALLKTLARFEEMETSLKASPRALEETLLSDNSPAEALLAEVDDRPIALVLFYPVFHSFSAKSYLFVEDLIVVPSYRRTRLWPRLVLRVLEICEERGFAGVEGELLDWNHQVRTMMKSIGAVQLQGWEKLQLDLAPATTLRLRRLARIPDPGG